ncbi:MAG: 23S rRNA pseudouridine(1911/1915/1917) synthase RluD [Granulosicoccus sp.]|nr:23S rRNA pseudouridine(1911/1915/1917) synthase RluD [Granulosicoccus sp.]
MNQPNCAEATVTPQWAGKRLDAAAAGLFSDFSRNRLQSWISEGYLTVDGQSRRAKDKLLGGERLSLQLPPDLVDALLIDAEGNSQDFTAEPVEFAVVHTDDDILVINKPAGLVMHPAPGNRNGTLLNGLLYRYPELHQVPRAGIVHRLDKDTSGLCVVARTLGAHTHLVRQLQERSMGREYLAIALGDVPHNGRVDAPVGRHPRDRKRMAVVNSGKPASTLYQTQERFIACAKLQVKLETGRTHQIRVHMAHIGHPLVGDPVYGRRQAVLPRQLARIDRVRNFGRQALHASKLSLIHPASNQPIRFETKQPEDLNLLCDALRDAAEPEQSAI